MLNRFKAHQAGDILDRYVGKGKLFFCNNDAVFHQIFHSGTAQKDGQFVTNGGRVLGVTAMGATMSEAIDKAYENIKNINFEKMHYRTDIGRK